MSLLLLVSIVAWLQIYRTLEAGPRMNQSAQQIATLVNLTRVALLYSDSTARVALIMTLAEDEHLHLYLSKTEDLVEPYVSDEFSKRITDEINKSLGGKAMIAGKVNGIQGLWVGFAIDGDSYWLRTEPSRTALSYTGTWAIWLLTAVVLSLAGAAVIAGLINQPLKQLSFAAGRMRDGDFDFVRLDEQVATSEVREVNIGFNRMATQLSKIEQDRVVMLAGISHDLRTPLARLRLETEMSVADLGARDHMVADIGQLDAIIDKFLDYARPEPENLEPISLNNLIDAVLYPVSEYSDMKVTVSIPADTKVIADQVDLSRVISNLIENSRRYGRTPDTGIALADISAKASGAWIIIKVRDHGQGVPPSMLPQLTNLFFRGDSARTSATGAGLGLAIVKKTVQRMGGLFSLSNNSDGGLVAHIKLRRG